jgi:hypothetical protein
VAALEFELGKNGKRKVDQKKTASSGRKAARPDSIHRSEFDEVLKKASNSISEEDVMAAVAVHDQITELQLIRDKVAQTRTELLVQVSDKRDALNLIDERLGKLALDRRIAVLRIADLRKSAQSLSTVFASSNLPDSVCEALNEKQQEIENLDLALQIGDERQKDVRQQRNETDAACRLAQKDLEEKEAELATIDQKISELRG